ncbi:sortase [Chloroflexota bacterium]
MRGRVFLFSILTLIILVFITSSPVLGLLLVEPLPTATLVVPTRTATITPTPTVDPFAHIPTATTVGSGDQAVVVAPPPTPALGSAPPTFTPAPTLEATEYAVILPDSRATSVAEPVVASTRPPLVIPTPAGVAPDRLVIPQLQLDAPVEQVGLVPSQAGEGVFEWAVPEHRAAGWLETSAPFGMAGNTVLDGHHNIQGEVFRDLWTLRPGDEIRLFAGEQSRVYLVDEVLILADRDQPLETRLANAQYLQPTAEERLTLITCWPYNDNTHRTIVIAYPKDPNL